MSTNIMTSEWTIVLSDDHGSNVTTFIDKTIVLPRTFATGSIHDNRFCYFALVGILFEVLRILLVAMLVTAIINMHYLTV